MRHSQVMRMVGPCAELLVCLRALKVIEQVVSSRSRLCVGPLQTSTSIAVILECSPSWTSVLHSLGVLMSYGAIEDFKKGLISKHEEDENGAFQDVKVKDQIVTLQIDNFDIVPLQCNKAHGKKMPMISGTATQSIVQSRKPCTDVQRRNYTQTGSPVAYKWLDINDVPSLQNRSAFIELIHNEDDRRILNDFINIAFGVVYQHRDSCSTFPQPHALTTQQQQQPELTNMNAHRSGLFLFPALNLIEVQPSIMLLYTTRMSFSLIYVE